MNNILKGTMFITDNLDYLYNMPLNGVKIISLDEDDVLSMDSKDIIGGTCLLPPMEAKIAEADGNEQMYDTYYSNHLLMPFQQQFISALLSFLYKGGNLIFFLPSIGYDNTLKKLTEHLFRIYGVHPGLIGDPNPQIANCYYDASCIPIWLNMIYSANVISAYEYLYMYPLDAMITNQAVVNLLMMELQPYGETINDRLNYIRSFHKKIHKNPNVSPAIQSLTI